MSMPILLRITHQGPTVRVLFSLVAAGFMCLSINAPVSADAPAAHDFRIAPQALASALVEFSKQADVQVLVATDVIRTLRTSGVVGHFTEEQALEQLLRGTELGFRWTAHRTITISPRTLVPAGSTQVGSADSAIRSERAASSLAAGNNSPQASPESGTLDEVVVTASKRAEPLRELADSVTAFIGGDLDSLGAESFQDYIGRAPGVQFQGSTPGVSNVTIRGVGTATVNPDQGQATTGIYLNDIPLTDPGFAVSIPDFDVFDMQRVEVMRGPQGTLFGTATLGGAVDYIINPVSLDKYEIHVQTEVSKTANASDAGYTAKIAVNVPLIDDVFGIRVTAIKRYDPGFLDNIGTGRYDSNTRKVEDYRLNALWKINDQTDLSLFTFYDRNRNGDAFFAFPQLGQLLLDTYFPEYASFITRINSLKFTANLGFATLTVQGADSRKSQDSDFDFTGLYGGVVPTSVFNSSSTHSDTTEARLTSPSNRALEWLFGTYYGHFYESIIDPTYQNDVDISYLDAGYKSNELSEFGEATYHFSDQWYATLGGRYYDIRLATDTLQGVPPTLASNGGHQQGTGFSPKGSLTYEPNKDLMIYALVSKGFRMGGVNLLAPIASFSTPATYKSDSLINYEIGIRPAWFQHTLTLDTTFFFIDWSDIQLRLSRPDGFDYVNNVGASHNKGIENTLAWRPNKNWALQASLTYLEAALAQSITLGGGTTLLNGATLPGASKWTTSETASYAWSTDLAPFLSASHRFVSSATSNFTETLPIGNYNVFDIRGGAHLGHDVTATLYVDNIADKRGVTASQPSTTFPTYLSEYYIRPRTFGLQFDWSL
jgi:iron complex outermembrane recepter protein